MIDILSNDFRQNPYPYYARIRQAGRAIYSQELDAWLVGRYDDVIDVLRDPETYSNRLSGLTLGDGQQLRKLRAAVSPSFAPRVLSSKQPLVDELARQALSAAAPGSEMDFVSDMADRVSKGMLLAMLGIPVEHLGRVDRWAKVLLSKGPNLNGYDRQTIFREHFSSLLSKKRRAYRRHVAEVRECAEFLRDHFASARTQKTGGWITDAILDAKTGSINEDEFVEIGMLLIVAATVTSNSLLGMAGYLLATDKVLQDRLRRQTELVDPFLQEVLRYEPPVQYARRYVERDAHIGDVSIPSGSHVLALIGSANRDPARFENPDQIVIGREPVQSLSFGAGPHYCVGAELARMEAASVFKHLLHHCPPFGLSERQGKIAYNEKLTLRKLESLKIKFDHQAV